LIENLCFGSLDFVVRRILEIFNILGIKSGKGGASRAIVSPTVTQLYLLDMSQKIAASETNSAG
jgi:hypothetical protein